MADARERELGLFRPTLVWRAWHEVVAFQPRLFRSEEIAR
jgi:hypothetical protein